MLTLCIDERSHLQRELVTQGGELCFSGPVLWQIVTTTLQGD